MPQQSQKFHTGTAQQESCSIQEQMQPLHQGSAARPPKCTELSSGHTYHKYKHTQLMMHHINPGIVPTAL
jgi:hypothetical protein